MSWINPLLTKHLLGTGGDVAAEIGFNIKEELGYIILCNHGCESGKQDEGWSKIWRNVIKYRQLMAKEIKNADR